MREIKFRAWDGRKMYYLDLYQTPSYDEPVDIVFRDREYEEQGWIDSHLTEVTSFLMQYTGLKDKNGKEIYEGDILDFVHLYGVRPAPIFWRNGGFWVAVNDPGYEDRWIVPDPEECEVIGNIYENPELLNPVK